MKFEEFQNQARLYVVGALKPSEIEEFKEARKQLGQKAEDMVRDCHELLHAFALSLQPAKSSAALKTRLMSMVRQRQ